MRKALKTLAMIFLLLMITNSGLAAILIGADCPGSVYSKELFTCKVYIFSLREEGTVSVYPHSAKGVFEVESPLELELNLEPQILESLEVNCWAKETGADALVVDLENSKKTGAVVPILVVEPSLKAFAETVTLEAGKTKEVEVKLRGEGYDVHVWLKSPTTSVDVSDGIYIDTVSGEKEVRFDITPSPTAFGSYTLFLYLSYVDERGQHVQKYKVSIWVNPSFYAVGIAIGALLAIVLLAYLVYRRWKGKKKEPSEAQ